MKNPRLIRTLLAASGALAMTGCQTSPEHEAVDELPVSAPGIATIASWNANLELNTPACIRVRIQPRAYCYNPAGAPEEPGIVVTLKQTPPGSGPVTRTYVLASPVDLLSIYNVSAGADVELQLSLPSPPLARGCASTLALSTIPAGVVDQPAGKITFEPSAAWGGTGAPPLPYTACNSSLYVTM